MAKLRRLAAVVMVGAWASGVCWPAAPRNAASEPPAIHWQNSTLTTPDGQAVTAESGTLSVPARHDPPAGGTVQLALLRLRSTAKKPEPPILFLSGGPGGSGTAAMSGPLLTEFLALRAVADVIALDQRGTGRSRPALVCRESWSHPLDRLIGKDQLLDAARERSRSCAEWLRSQGHDLAAFNTIDNADDLESLRQALGVPRLQLLGTSYGTQLALAALRRHPTRFARAVLLSPKGTQHGLRLPSTFDAHLRAIDETLAQDPRLRGTFPHFLSTLTAVLDRLTRAPRPVVVPLPQSKGAAELLVGAFDLQSMVVQALASRQETERLPARLQRMSEGDFVALGQYALGLRRGWLGAAMPYLIECSSGLSAARHDRIRKEAGSTLLGAAVDFPFPEICAGWAVPDLGNEWRDPVKSAIPTLVVAGTLDVRTPLEDAREILSGLSAGVLVTADGFGHGDDFFAAPEVGQAIRRFFAGREVPAHAVTLPPLQFLLDPPAVTSARAPTPAPER